MAHSFKVIWPGRPPPNSLLIATFCLSLLLVPYFSLKDHAHRGYTELPLIVPRKRLCPGYFTLPCWLPAPHLLQARTRKHTSPTGQEPEKDTRSLQAQQCNAKQAAASSHSWGTQYTKPKHTISYPLPPFPWQTWGAHPPWDSRLSLHGEEKRQRASVTWPPHTVTQPSEPQTRGASCSETKPPA